MSCIATITLRTDSVEAAMYVPLAIATLILVGLVGV